MSCRDAQPIHEIFIRVTIIFVHFICEVSCFRLEIFDAATRAEWGARFRLLLSEQVIVVRKLGLKLFADVTLICEHRLHGFFFI